jgi:hypothetical protein
MVVKVDGSPYPVLELGIAGGLLPALSWWVRSGTHDTARWQHGYRRPPRPAGVVVVNRPADAAI